MEPSRTRARLVRAFEQGNWASVQHRARQALLADPEDAQVHFMLGVALLRDTRFDAAVAALHEAVVRDSSRSDHLAYYAKALAAARRLSEACDAADKAMAMTPSDLVILAMLGTVYMQANAIDAAADARRRAVALAPGRADFRFGLGQALTALGDTDAAERELEAGLRLNEREWAVHLSLAKLRRQRADSNHLERLRNLVAKYADNPAAQIYLNMAIAKECEDLGDYAAAFGHYSRGKKVARSARASSVDRDHAMFQAITRAFPGVQQPDRESGVPDAPIFIVGMPRTGTTLLDRMVSSHKDVFAAGELQNFPTALQRASGAPIALFSLPDIAAHTNHIDWAQLGADYIDSTRPATAACPRFTDDMPLNFLYAGFIARALPHAKIICLRRNPVDTCLGNFRNLFRMESGFYDYSLDLLDIGRYFIEFDRLMAHWRNVLPGRILEVEYESLVTKPEPAMRKVLAFCDLTWDAACLHPEDNATPVNTPNAWQVRAPVYTSAIGRWRRYETELQPLRELLADAGIDVPT